MKRSFFNAITLVAGLVTSSMASAAMIYFEDRSAFEAALSSIVVENMDEVVARQQSLQTFNDFDITFRNGFTSWGCPDDNSGCGNSSSYWSDFGSLWTYDAENVFTFDTAVYAFGFDFGQVNGELSAPTINGVARSVAGNEGAFFGAISSVALTEWTFTNPTAFSVLIDNITYSFSPSGSSSVDVPEPTAFAIFALGIFGLALSRYKRKV